MIILLFQYRHEVVISDVIFWLFCYATVTINIIVTVSVIEVSLSVSHVPLCGEEQLRWLEAEGYAGSSDYYDSQ